MNKRNVDSINMKFGKTDLKELGFVVLKKIFYKKNYQAKKIYPEWLKSKFYYRNNFTSRVLSNMLLNTQKIYDIIFFENVFIFFKTHTTQIMTLRLHII